MRESNGRFARLLDLARAFAAPCPPQIHPAGNNGRRVFVRERK
jgi:hypothetical protein